MRPAIQRPQLDHVVDKADDGLGPRVLVLEISQPFSRLVAVALVSLVIDGLGEGGRLAPDVDEQKDELLVALAEQVLGRDVQKVNVARGKVAAKVLKLMHY